MPRKQIIGLILYCVVFIYIKNYHSDFSLLVIGMGLPLLVMGFGPYIYNKIGLPMIYRFIPLLVAMVFPVSLITIHFEWLSLNYQHYIFVILPILVLLLCRYRMIKVAISIAPYLEPITKRKYSEQVIKIISLIIGEELLFRIFFYSFFVEPGVFEVILGSLLFVYFHYFNRFSSTLYNAADYFYQFLVGIILGLSIIKFELAFLPLFFGHLIYNSINIVSLTIQKNNERSE